MARAHPGDAATVYAQPGDTRGPDRGGCVARRSRQADRFRCGFRGVRAPVPRPLHRPRPGARMAAVRRGGETPVPGIRRRSDPHRSRGHRRNGSAALVVGAPAREGSVRAALAPLAVSAGGGPHGVARRHAGPGDCLPDRVRGLHPEGRPAPRAHQLVREAGRAGTGHPQLVQAMAHTANRAR